MSFFNKSSNKNINQIHIDHNNEILLRILVIGKYGVGKTSIIQKLVYDKFDPLYNSTIGVDFSVKFLNINNSVVKLHLWDTAGQERFRSITKTFYKNNAIYILVFDLSDFDSFIDLNKFISDIKDSYLDSKYFLIGNKSDIKKDDRINDYLIKDFIERNQILKYFEASSKLTNFTPIFEEIVKILLKQPEIINYNINNTNNNIILNNENIEKTNIKTNCC